MQMPSPRKLTKISMVFLALPLVGLLIGWISIKVIPGCGMSFSEGLPTCLIGGVNIAEPLNWLVDGGFLLFALGVFLSLPLLLVAAGMVLWQQIRGKTST